MNNSSAHAKNLFPHKRKLLETFLKQRGGEFNAFPLSFAQQRLWFLHQLEPDSPAYHISTAVWLEGHLDIASLERSLSEIVSRHEVLRTSFSTINGQPFQVIAPAQQISLPLIDLSGMAEGEREARALLMADQEAQCPFDLTAGPVMRVTLFKLDGCRYLLLIVMHHIVSDAWSSDVFIRELSVLYSAFLQGLPSPLPELAIQYADYAVWQREYLQGDRYNLQLEFWKKQLEGAPAVLELPTDRARPAVKNYRGASEPLTIASDLSSGLKEISRREGVTLFITSLAAFKAFLFRYSGQTDLLIGSPVANRANEETDSLIGFFVNMLTLRSQVRPDQSLRELIRRERECVAGALAHQDLPFEQLIDALRIERRLSHTPLFQVVLTVGQTGASIVGGDGLQIKPAEIENRTSKFDLMLSLLDAGKELHGSLEYDTDLFERSTVTRMIWSFQNLLRALIADPDEKVSKLRLLGDAERDEILFAWGAASKQYYSGKTLVELIEKQSTLRGEAVALVCRGEQLTYRELDQRANRLASYLRREGAGPGQVVAIFMERSIDLIVGIVGILKAGAAYLPLDPVNPRQRLEYLLEDAGVILALTEERLMAELPLEGRRIICLDRQRDTLESLSQESASPLISGEDAAYIIYTSGSTGKPKGMVITHRNVVRLFEATEESFGFGEEDVWSMFHSVGFDFSVWEIFGALIYGGKLVVVPHLVSRTPEEFYELVEKERVTFLSQTPSAFRLFMDVDAQERGLLGLKWVVFGGEALELGSLKGWIERRGDEQPQLVNMYGITETTVHVTYRKIREDDLKEWRGSVIGAQIRDLQMYVMDEELEPAPVGVRGELYVGGEGLGRGYLNRAAMTAEKFVPHPHAGRGGERLYQTGDLGRWRAKGEIEYLGRADEQLKLRGYRIELGEIECALLEDGEIEEAAVVVREGEGGDRRLEAYVVTRPGAIKASEIRRRIKERLPEYMVPAGIVMVEKIPLTENGKVDRKALLGLGRVERERDDRFVGPSNEIEEVLTAIFGHVLGVEEVGVEDSFFALGGDSIKSVQVMSLARERALRFSLQDLFQHPIVKELAMRIREAEDEVQTAEVGAPFSLIGEEDLRRMPGGVEDAYPLTRLQAGMLYNMELMPGHPVYHNINSIQVRMRFEPEIFREAVRGVVARHPVLRTSFDLTNFSEPLQLVHETASLDMQVEDISHLSPSEQEKIIDDVVESEKKRRFDLSRAPLFRLRIHIRADEMIQFTLTECHAILDGWSLQSTLNEIFSDYFAMRDGASLPEKPPLAARFRDFVLLERLASQSEECRRFWDEKLRDFTVTELPYKLKEAQVSSGPRIRMAGVEVPEEISDGLKRLARVAAIPLKSILLAAHLKVMSVLSGQTDVLTGISIHGRPEGVDGANVRGLFLNTPPFRFKLEPGAWLDLARAVFDAEREMLPHRRYSLVEIQAERGGVSLFDTIFNFVHFHVLDGLLQTDNLEVEGFKRSEETNFKLHVAFSVNAYNAGVGLDLEYDATKLGEEHMRELAGYYKRALRAMAVNPLEPHEAACLLAEAERQRVEQWGRAEEDYPAGICLHQLFDARAQRHPKAIALTFEEEQISYGELNRRANQLAHYLRSRGAGPEMLVGIYLERSVEMIVALLATLKAGAAYLPIDTAYPPERVSLIVEDSRMSSLITNRSLAERFQAIEPRMICLDEAQNMISEQNAETPAVEISPAAAAYVIYTSGSTGKPKGVAVTHYNVMRLFEATEAWFSFNEKDVWTLFHSYAFDFSVWELWGALLYGGRVVIVPYWASRTPEAFYELLHTNCVTVLNQTPSAFQQLIQAEDRVGVKEPALRLVILGGEALDLQSLEPWMARHGDERPRVINMYGITETTVFVTYRPLSHTDLAQGAGSMIGRQIPDLQLYLLNQYRQPVPVGVAGEIYVGGSGLGRGYLRRPGLTAERFVPNPFSGETGARLYKSGDLARCLLDGDIEYLGRIDDQVKIRGYRIELGEIEVVIREQEGVRDAVVLVRDEGEEKSLIAYVVGDVEVNEMRRNVNERLPAYMTPGVYVKLEEMPLTPNGKIDRKALASHYTSRPALDNQDLPPRTPTEHALAEIYTDLLGIGSVGVESSFFDLGGHSLLATRLVSRVRNTFQVELPLRYIFEKPSIAEMARFVDEAIRTGEGLSISPIRAVARDRALPLSFGQQRLWFLNRFDPDDISYNISSSLRLQGGLDVEALRRSFDEIIARHEVLRTTFSTSGNRPVQVIAPPTPAHLAMIDLSRQSANEDEARRLAAEEANTPFDLSRGPLLRVTLMRLSDEDHFVLLTMHHIISDGWSMGVLAREFAALYEAFSMGRPTPLPDLPIQYADYAVWQREWVEGAVLDAHLAYWRERLESSSMALDLPTDLPRPQAASFRGATRSKVLTGIRADELKELGRREGVTLFMTLLAGFKVLLHKYSGQDDIIVGSPTANRTCEEIEPLIGFFVNTIVLRTDLVGDPSFRELLGRIREVTLGAYAHQDMPFERLVEALNPPRDLSRHPVFQAMFALQNAPLPPVELPGLRFFVPTWSNNDTSKYDLSLFIESTNKGLVASLEYCADLFDQTTIDGMLEHYEKLLSGAVKEPERRVSELGMLSEKERARLIEGGDETEVRLGANPSLVHEMFSAQAARTPLAIAVSYERESLTYRELDRRSNQLAHYLRARGVGPDRVVGLMMDRRVEMVVALLGILKAGGAYLPLDDSYPEPRLRLMIEDGAVKTALTLAGSRELVCRLLDDVICLDQDWERIAQAAESQPENLCGSLNLAYLLYTSGSTGRPKGVMVTHGGLSNYLEWSLKRYQIGEGIGSVVHSPLSFDLTVTSLYGPLLAGGRIELAAESPGIEGLERSLKASGGWSLLKMTPAHLEMLSAGKGAGELVGKVGALVIGGEALKQKLVRKLWEQAPGTRIVNEYGPTETVVGCSVHEVGADENREEMVSIGRPIRGTRIYVLDQHQRLAPVGVRGELCVGGVGVARGYARNAEQTAERFAPDPYSGIAGARMYRTGDIGRRRRDGSLEFVGRRDNQVKIRGFRIELGEIEVMLAEHPAVAECVVTAYDGGNSERNLVAYVVFNGDRKLTVSEMRSYLGQMLPGYMLPGALVWLESMPLMANGKVDRRALPAPKGGYPEMTTPYAPPQTDVEQQIAMVWQEALQMEKVSVNDNFFDLGGHSLLVIQVLGELQEIFGYEIPTVEMFRNPTISSMARYLNEQQSEPLLYEQSRERAERRKESSRTQKGLRAQSRAQRRGGRHSPTERLEDQD